MKPGFHSFFDLPVGTLFMLPNDTSTKVPRPYVKTSERQFSRPGGTRQWMMFAPSFDTELAHMVLPVHQPSALNHQPIAP